MIRFVLCFSVVAFLTAGNLFLHEHHFASGAFNLLLAAVVLAFAISAGTKG